jgi:ribonuclease R
VITRAAVLERRGRFTVARPVFARPRGEDDFASGPLTVDPGKARVGDLVLVSVKPGSRGARGRVVSRLGRPDVARDVIEALMLDRGLRRRFEPVVERAARESADGVGPESGGPRRDLRDLATFTIDPRGAKDFDDAISAVRLDDDGAGRRAAGGLAGGGPAGGGPAGGGPAGGGGVRVWVHIADVAAFVRPGSPVDREARRRATSVYVPGAVEPMLPPALSNEACSLVPGKDRLVVTAELDFDGPRVRRASFYRAVIRSDERLDYDRVDRIFAGREAAEEPWAGPLEAARTVARALAGERARRGSLAIVSGEPEFAFSGDGQVVGISFSEQTESHELIEHLMIAANEEVAKLLATRKLPTLYRVHEQPEPARVDRLVAQLASLEVPTPPIPKLMSASAAAELVGEVSRAVDRYVRATGHGRLALTSLVLRSLKQAYYSPRNLGHSGLRSTGYCHFTSPIRRYPDLVCHRALLGAIGVEADAPSSGGLGELGEWTSQRERAAMEIERAADDVARCFALVSEDREAEWDGEIVGLIGAGAFVAFGGRYEGMLAVRRMLGDWWELNEEGTILHGERRGGVLRLGDPVRVRVHAIDPLRGRVDLELA